MKLFHKALLASIALTFTGTAFAGGSTFSEVWSKVKSDPYSTMPQYKVTYASLFLDGVNMLARSVTRTLNDDADLLPRFQKLVHPIGICFAGNWNITEASPYSGYFAKGSKGLIILRASEAMGNAEVGEYRAFGLAGKLFPTSNPQDPTPYQTANFFTVDDLGGTKSKSFLDLGKTNEPKTTFHPSAIFIFPTLTEIARTISAGDKDPTIRQVYPISELGLDDASTAKTPKWFMLRADNAQRNGAKDFRNELRLANFPDGLKFGIFVSDSGQTKWTRLGQITLTDEALSDSCDHALHFSHPKTK